MTTLTFFCGLRGNTSIARWFALWLLAVAAAFSTGRVSAACCGGSSDTEGVSTTISIKMCLEGTADVTLEGRGLAGADEDLGTLTETDRNFDEVDPSPIRSLVVDEVYTLTTELTSAGQDDVIATTHIGFDVPDGYYVLIGKSVDALAKTSEINKTEDQTGTDSWVVVIKEEGCCGDDGTSGTCSEPGVGSVTWGVNVGLMPNGRSAGRIMLRETELTADSYTRGRLLYSPPAYSGNDFVTVTRDGNGDLTKIATELAVVELTDLTSPTGVQIAFYENDGTGSKTGAAYAVWQITDTSHGGTPNTKIKFEKTTGGAASSDTYEVTYDDTPGGGADYSWTMVTGDGSGSDPDLRKVVRTTTIIGAGVGQVRTDVEEIKDTNDIVLRKTTYKYETFAWGEEMIEQVADPDGEALTTAWVYYEDDTEVGRYGKVKSIEYEDGRWVQYDYYFTTNMQDLLDDLNTAGNNIADVIAAGRIGQVKQELRAWDDVALSSGPTENTAYSIDYEWEPIPKNARLGNGFSVYADQLVSEKHYIPTGTDRVQIESKDILIESVKEKTWIPANAILYTQTRFLDPDNVTDTSQAIVSETLMSRQDVDDIDPATTIEHWTVDVDTAGKPLWEKSDDGRMMLYQYEAGTYTDSGAASAASFSTAADDGSFSVSRIQGVELTAAPGGGDDVEYPNDDLETAGDYQNAVKLIVNHSTKTVTVYDAFGRMALTEKHTWDGTIWTRRSWTVTRYNIEGQATSQYFHDGTSTSTTYGADNRVESMTDQRGLKTEYGYDEVGRRNTTKHYADLTTDIILRETKTTYDAAGRAIKTERKPDGGSYYTVSETEYDDAGRTSMRKDALGKLMFYTYNDVKADGSDYLQGTDTGPWFSETRVYPHNKDSGAVNVTWTDNQGSTVRQWAGTSTATWTEVSPPSGTETLTEVARTAMAYEAPRRVESTRQYFDLASLTLNQDGTKDTNYYESKVLFYDMAGRALRSQDAMDDITARVYDGSRMTQAWRGLDDTGATIDDPSGAGGNDMVQLSQLFYDSDRDGTGDELGYVTRSQSLKPVSTDPPTFSTSNTATDFEQTYTSSGMVSWTKPELGPWSKQLTDYQGRSVESLSYQNGSTSYILTKATSHYDDANTRPWRMTASRVHEVNGSGGTTGNHLETTYEYDDAERQVKVASAGGGFSKTAYDDENRVLRRVSGSEEGTNADADAFTDDIILTESVPTYDTLGNVVKTVTYERNHDAGTYGGLLSSDTTKARVNTSLTWYDDAHRPTHQVAFGTNTPSASYDDPTTDTAPEPNTSDDYLVSKVEYDARGRRYQTTDNLGRKTRVEFDDLGRTTKLIENYVDGAPLAANADEDRITTYVYNAVSQKVAETADLEGTSNDQTTKYIYSSELTDKGGPVKSNSVLRAIIMPDSDDVVTANALANGTDATYDRTELTYYANGQIYTTTDPRGVQVERYYTNVGWLEYTQLNPLTGHTWTVVGDWFTSYTYGDLGERLTASTFDQNSNQTSKLTYTYDGFYNRLTEKQDHDPSANSGAGVPKTITSYFDTSLSGNIYDKANRFIGVGYPNGRIIEALYDGHNGIDDSIGRVTKLADYDGSTSTDIVSYTYLGAGHTVRKDYATPDVRLDFIDEGSEGSDSNDDYEIALDRFGRPLRYQWETYDGSGDADEDLIHIAHAYDRNSNRLYDDRKAPGNTGFSTTLGRDELDRITTSERGILIDNAGTKEINWLRRSEDYSLDALGNPTQVDRETQAPYTPNITHNDANELGTREVYEKAASAKVEDAFSSSATASDWDTPGSDTFNITVGYLQPTSVTADSINGQTEAASHGLFLWGPELGPANIRTSVTFDPSLTATTRAGFVFGYQDPHNYWITVLKYVPGGQSVTEVCQIVNGALAVIASKNANISSISGVPVYVGSARDMIQNGGLVYTFPNGYPAGRVGIYTDNTLVKFNYCQVWPHDEPSDLAGRWDRHSNTGSASDSIRVSNSADARHYPTFLRGVTVPASQPWRTTVMFTRSGASRNDDGLRFLFNVRDRDTYSALAIRHATTQVNPNGVEYVGGAGTSVSGTVTTANVATAANQNDQLWARIESDGTNVSLKMVVDNTGAPSESTWSATGVAYTSASFNMTGGQVGFRAFYGNAYIKHVKVETDANNDSTFVTEYEDDISAWAEYEPIEHEHDAAGNTTFDGEKWYTYDAYNRLVKVQNAYRIDATTIGKGSTLGEYAYDAQGRRIRKDTYLGGVLDNVEHFYYHGQSLIETRNGSDQVTQQHVWDSLAGQYIDSLAQVANNTTQGVDDLCDQKLYALQDQQFNILALVDDTGDVVERYEYTLYGQRQVMKPAYATLGKSAYAMNMGFQGLYHDDESGLLYNRARMFNPQLGRFNQRDPLGYPDGMNTYAAYHVMRDRNDPTGLASAFVAYETNYSNRLWNYMWKATVNVDWTSEEADAEGNVEIDEVAGPGNPIYDSSKTGRITGRRGDAGAVQIAFRSGNQGYITRWQEVGDKCYECRIFRGVKGISTSTNLPFRIFVPLPQAQPPVPGGQVGVGGANSPVQVTLPGGITIQGNIGSKSATYPVALMICAGDADKPEQARGWFVESQKGGTLDSTTVTPTVEWDEQITDDEDLFEGLENAP